MLSWLSSIDSPPASACSPSVNGSRSVCTRPPTRPRASSTTTSQPASFRSSAAVSPARPAPAITTRRLAALCSEAVSPQPATSAKAARSARLCAVRRTHGRADASFIGEPAGPSSRSQIVRRSAGCRGSSSSASRPKGADSTWRVRRSNDFFAPLAVGSGIKMVTRARSVIGSPHLSSPGREGPTCASSRHNKKLNVSSAGGKKIVLSTVDSQPSAESFPDQGWVE